MGIIARDLSVTIQNRLIFSNVNLNIEKGTAIAIVGQSGSGKTTLLNCLSLIQKPSAGSIMIDGVDYSSHQRKKILDFWETDAALIYQDSGVIDDESLQYNVVLRRSIRRNTLKKAAQEAISAVGLGGRENEKAAVLSGGEKQRLGVARAIYKNAQYIFADEPTASLDEQNRLLVQQLLIKRAREGKCVIIATHDLKLADECDVIFELSSHSDGK